MTTYEERRDNLAINSSILVQVMLGDAHGDAEFSLVRPRPANASVVEGELKGRRPGLRVVGFIGLVDGAPQLVSKELLDPQQIEALAAGFAVYVATLVKTAITSGSFTAEIERAEVAEIERLYALPDDRYVN